MGASNMQFSCYVSHDLAPFLFVLYGNIFAVEILATTFPFRHILLV